MKKTIKTGSEVTIKGYKKIHTINAVYICKPPKSESFLTYKISDTPENKRYLAKDLILVNN